MSETLFHVASFKKGFIILISHYNTYNGTLIHFTVRCQMYSITTTSTYDSVKVTISTTGQTGHDNMQNINLKSK